MNAGIYKLIWSDSSKSPVVVPETAKSHGKKSAGSAKAVASILSALTIFSLPLTGFSGPNEVPTDGSVVGGDSVATISKGGIGVLNINQYEQKAIINWDTFNIGKNAVVNFIQPNTRSTALNRVVGSDPSHIFGQLNANGQVILINPNGVLFGVGSSVNVGGIVATTMDIKNKDFNNNDGVWNFFTTADGVNGSVINRGDITAKKNGYIALMAPEVVNGSEGVLTANLGTVALASGDKVALSIEGRDLIAIHVEPSKLNALIENKHIIVAENGQVLMSASALSALEGAAIQDVDLTPKMELENGIVRIVNRGDVTTGSMDVMAAGNASHEIFVGGNVQTAANLSVTSMADDGVGSASSSIALGGLTVDGELNVSSSAGDIMGINNKRIQVFGNTSLDAGAGSIDLSNSRNDFNTVQANATGDITLTDRNGIVVTNASAYGSLAINANVNGVDSGEVVLGDLSVGADLGVNSNGGNITQAELTVVQVSGDVNLDARDGVSDPARTSGDVNAANSGNLLDGAVSLYANNAALSSDSGMQINEAIIEGDLTLNALGNVTQTQPLEIARSLNPEGLPIYVAGKTSITSGGDILIDNLGNNFIGEVSLQSTAEGVTENGSITSPTISIADADAILFGDVSTAGNLEVYALSGNIKQSEDTAIKAKGNTQIFADDGNVKLGNEGNDFNKLALQVINGDVIIGDKNGIAISGVINTGSLSINANADKEGRQGAVVFDGDTEVGSNLAVKSNGGNIRKTDEAFITVAGTTVLNAAAKKDKDNGNINFANKLEATAEVYGDVTLLGDVSLYGNKVSLLNDTDLYLASANPNKPAVEATGDVLLATTVGDIYVNGLIKADSDEEQQVTIAAGVYAGTYREYINDALVQDPDQLQDVIFADSASIEMGEEGNWRIYSDNPITAGHAPGTWVAENSSKRYNVAYMAPSMLTRGFIGGGDGGSSERNEEHDEGGNFAYYRMQPVLLVNATSHETVYGNKTKITYNRDEDISGYIYDDMYLDKVSGKLQYTLDGATSTTGHYVAGLHNALFDYDLGLLSKLGYGFEELSPVTVQINRRELSISDVLAASRYYNGNNSATLSGGVLHGVLSEHDHHDDDHQELIDVVGIKSMSGQFESAQPTGSYDNRGNNASKRYVASMQVTLQGDDAQNYVVTTYDTHAPHQSKQGYQADGTPVINPPVPGQEQPAHNHYHHDDEHSHNHDESRGGKGGHEDHDYDKDHKGDDRSYNKDHDDDRSHDKDRGHKSDKKDGKGKDDDRDHEDKKHGKDRDHDHKHKKDKKDKHDHDGHGHDHEGHDHGDHDHEHVAPGPIEAEIWELPVPAEPPVIPQYVPTPLEVLDEPRNAPVDLQSTLTESLFDESGTTSMSGDFTAVQPLGTYNISKGTGIEIEVPASTFKHSDPNAQLEYSAQLENGNPLPEWLKFDPAIRTLKGTPPDGQSGTAVVKIIVRDTNGGEASSSLTINY
jgi:filamentous hemagglutinin family protein